jgi:hypothetical protein
MASYYQLGIKDLIDECTRMPAFVPPMPFPPTVINYDAKLASAVCGLSEDEIFILGTLRTLPHPDQRQVAQLISQLHQRRINKVGEP